MIKLCVGLYSWSMIANKLSLPPSKVHFFKGHTYLGKTFHLKNCKNCPCWYRSFQRGSIFNLYWIMFFKKPSLNSRFINFDEKPVSFKRCRLLWAFENWELAPWEYFFSVFAYFERYKLTAWPIFDGFRSGHSKTSV